MRFYTHGLLSKWGFKDGDCLYDIEGMPEDVNARHLLADVVRAHVLPKMKQRIEVVQIETCHNPIRAKSVDGADVQDRWDDTQFEMPLEPDFVDVDDAFILAMAKQANAQADSPEKKI